MQHAVVGLRNLGPFPSEKQALLDQVKKREQYYHEIEPPLTNEEACVLVRLFGPDDYFGLAEALMIVIETAPGWPIEQCLRDRSNPWVRELRDRAERGGLL